MKDISLFKVCLFRRFLERIEKVTLMTHTVLLSGCLMKIGTKALKPKGEADDR